MTLTSRRRRRQFQSWPIQVQELVLPTHWPLRSLRRARRLAELDETMHGMQIHAGSRPTGRRRVMLYHQRARGSLTPRLLNGVRNELRWHKEQRPRPDEVALEVR